MQISTWTPIHEHFQRLNWCIKYSVRKSQCPHSFKSHISCFFLLILLVCWIRDKILFHLLNKQTLSKACYPIFFKCVSVRYSNCFDKSILVYAIAPLTSQHFRHRGETLAWITLSAKHEPISRLADVYCSRLCFHCNHGNGFNHVNFQLVLRRLPPRGRCALTTCSWRRTTRLDLDRSILPWRGIHCHRNHLK